MSFNPPLPPHDNPLSSIFPRVNSQRLRHLFDVSSARPDDGDLLAYNTEVGKWEPSPGNFDDRYAALDHNHDAVYAPLGHNHDTVYAPLSHTHDDRYYTESESDSRFAPLNHNHSGVYAPVSHSHSAATTSSSGFMSSSDKTKLNGIATGATSNSASNSTPQTIMDLNPNSGSSGSSALYSRADHKHPSPGTATPSRDGWMTRYDKSKLDGIEAGATSNAYLSSPAQPTYMGIAFGGGTAGTSPLAARADHAHGSPGLASTIQDGWMSSTDKARLDTLWNER